jgi:cytochrome b6-f complex iron-sulfur subunit
MADKLADLSPEERAQRVAEMKAKMQSAAKKAKSEADVSTDQPAAAEPATAAAAPVAVVAAAPAPAVAATAETKSVSNGHTGNGAAAAAEVAAATTVIQAAPYFEEESPEEKARKQMNRREFLTYAWGAALGLLALEALGATFFFMYPRFRAGEFGGTFFIGPESALPPSDAPPVPFTDGKFWLVTLQDQQPKALYMVCTHLGCLYKWAGSNFRFECPCHGSKFSHDGFYIEGPAPRSLDSFAITIEDGVVAVNTGKKITGEPAADSPARAVPA